MLNNTMYENVKHIAKDYVDYVKKVEKSKKPALIKFFLIKRKYKHSTRSIRRMVKKAMKYVKGLNESLNSLISLAEDIFNNLIKFVA